MSGVLPYTIGIKVTKDDKTCSKNIILKGTTLPTCVKRNCCVKENGQKTVCLEMLKNESEEATSCAKCSTPLGTFEMPLPEGVTAGEPIEFIFTAGLNGLLICTCKCKDSLVEKTIDI